VQKTDTAGLINVNGKVVACILVYVAISLSPEGTLAENAKESKSEQRIE